MALKIGKTTLKNRLILAPMHGVNCTAFRIMCKQNGAALVTTPMMHAPSIISRKGLLDQVVKEERPISIQVIGSEPKQIAKAVEIVTDYADVIDLNFGCPDHNIVKQKMGAYFAKHPDETRAIISAAIDHTNKPVTVKIRSGWDDRKHSYLDIAKTAEDLGASAVALHARTKTQRYFGKADWSNIKKLKSEVNIPVIGNGDIWKAEDAKRMLEETGCDFAMIGRGAMGNPHIFKQSLELIKNNKRIPSLDNQGKTRQLIDFISLTKKYPIQFTELKRHALWFCVGMRNAAEKKRAIARTKTQEEMMEALNSKSYKKASN